MDDNSKTNSYQLDQEILDARGINMTVEEVAGLPTCTYAERVRSLCLNDDDLGFLKGLRRRIKNRLASQNSRRRSMEHLRRLTRELRAVRACRDDALAERRSLLAQRQKIQQKCQRLRQHVVKILQERSDPTEVPIIELERVTNPESHTSKEVKKVTVTETKTPLLPECFKSERENIFECRIDKLVQQSVNHMYKEKSDRHNDRIVNCDRFDNYKIDRDDVCDRFDKKIFAKTIFINNASSKVDSDGCRMGDDVVLNLSVKERRKSHGRKQSAPRRITYICDYDDSVLDLKVKREPQ